MNAEWQSKLADFGVQRQGDDLVYPESPDAINAICTLSSETVLHISGEDAESFLQAQFSNDISTLDLPGSQLSTWSSPKGRVITVFRVAKVDGGYLLRIPNALVDPVLKRLRMYVLMAKVVIEPRPDLVVAGVSGEGSEQGLSDAGINIPRNTDQTTALAQGGCVTRVRGAIPRFEIIADAGQMAELWSKCMAHCQIASDAIWRLQNIDAGVPTVTGETTEAFVLQMLNLQHIDGVSFKKGCFPGQEVVARMQYLGKLKRKMFRLQFEGSHIAAPGDEIYKAGGGSAAGKVVDAASASDGASRLLAVIAIDATAEQLYLDKDQQQPLTLLEIPYATPAPECRSE